VISPGGVNLLGEYIDYNSGVILQAVIDRYVTMVIEPRSDDWIIMHAINLDASAEFSLKELNKRRDLCGEPLLDWALLPAAAAWEFQNKGFISKGMEAVFASSFPIGAAARFGLFCEYWQVTERDDMFPFSGIALSENGGLNCNGSIYFL